MRFDRTISASWHTFTIYYQNVRGLRTKTNDLLLALNSCDYDIIAFTETWLQNDIANAELSACYNIYRCDRNLELSGLQRGGGVLVGVKKCLQCTLVLSSATANSEQIAIRVTLPNRSVVISSVYIRPNSS